MKNFIIIIGAFYLLTSCIKNRGTENSILVKEEKANIKKGVNANSTLNVSTTKRYIFKNKNVNELKIDCNSSFLAADSVLSLNVSFVKLETNQDCLIGEIEEILFDENKIFIIDKRISKSVFIFDIQGKYLGKISNQGKGPGEYVEIQDVTLNKWSKEIHILDAFGGKINCYNYLGHFLKGVKLKTMFHSFEYLDKNTEIRYKNRNFCPDIPAIQFSNLYSVSKNKILSNGFEESISQDKFSWNTRRQLWNFDKKIYYNNRFSDTIYRVSSDTVYATYYLNMLGNNIPFEEKGKLTNNRFEELKKQYGYLNGSFVELKDFAFMSLSLPKGNINVFYSKKTGRIISGKKVQTMHPMLIFFNEPKSLFKDNVFVESVDAAFVKRFQWNKCPVKSEYPQYEEVFERLNRGLDLDDNPVLFFYTIKDF